MGAYGSIDRLIAMCDEVLATDPPGLRQKVVARYVVTFARQIEEETGTRTRLDIDPSAVDPASVEMIRELLLAHRDRMEYDYMMAKATADQIDARATATVEANVTVDFNQTVKQIAKTDGVPRETLDAIELALSRLRAEAEEGSEADFAERAKEALDLASKGAGLVPKVSRAIGTLAALFSL